MLKWRVPPEVTISVPEVVLREFITKAHRVVVVNYSLLCTWVPLELVQHAGRGGGEGVCVTAAVV